MLQNKEKNINLIGALTSKPYAFTARSWELKSYETIDLFDSLNSNIKVNVRGSNIMRILPATNENINEEWISDKARFAFDGLKRWRFISPMIKNEDLFSEVNWKQAINFIRSNVSQEKYENFILKTGNFLDLESICSLKDFSNKIEDIYLEESNYDFDFQSDYLINESFDKIKSPKVFLIIGTNLRLENPILNIKIRKLSKQNNILIGYIGSFFDSTYEMYHLGNDMNTLKKIYEGKHWFCSYISRFLKRNNNYDKITNSIKNNVSVILGEEFFNNKNAKSNYKSLKNLENKLFKVNYNILVPYSGIINALELGLYSNINISVKSKKNVEYLVGVENSNSIKDEDFVIYQGHHNDSIRTKVDVILPSVNWFEKNSLFLNCLGMIQKTRFMIQPPSNSRNDWKITQMLNIFLNNKLNYSNLKNLHIKLERLSPKIMNNVNKYNYKKLINFNFSKYINKTTINNTLFKSNIHNYYGLSSIERASKVMNDCSKELTSQKNNYFKNN